MNPDRPAVRHARATGCRSGAIHVVRFRSPAVHLPPARLPDMSGVVCAGHPSVQHPLPYPVVRFRLPDCLRAQYLSRVQPYSLRLSPHPVDQPQPRSGPHVRAVSHSAPDAGCPPDPTSVTLFRISQWMQYQPAPAGLVQHKHGYHPLSRQISRSESGRSDQSDHPAASAGWSVSPPLPAHKSAEIQTPQYQPYRSCRTVCRTAGNNSGRWSMRASDFPAESAPVLLPQSPDAILPTNAVPAYCVR